MNKPRTSIKDIAKLIGMTDVTVSRAFTVPEKVKKETRDRIYEAAKKLNYTPNMLARQVRNARSNIIGLIADDIFNPVYMHVIKALNVAAELQGYSVMIFNTNGSRQSEEEAVNTLLSYNAAGVIISAICDNPEDNKHLDKLANAQMAVIQFDRQFSETLPGVFIDNDYAGRLAGTQALGATLIIGGLEDSVITQTRIRGIVQTLPEGVIPTILYSHYHMEKATSLLSEYLSEHENNFECVISVTGLISLAAISVFTGKKMFPKIISIDELPYSEIYGLEYTCVSHDYTLWAHRVAQNLFDMIKLNKAPSRSFIKGRLRKAECDADGYPPIR